MNRGRMATVTLYQFTEDPFLDTRPLGSTTSERVVDHERPATEWRVRGAGSGLTPRPGDVIFGNRLSWVQAAKNVSADQLTHCAVVAELDGHIVVVEVGPKGCVTRPVEAFVDAYRHVAIARPAATAACAKAMTDWAVDRVGEEVNYAWSHFGVAGVASMARRFLPRVAQPTVVRTSRRLARTLDARTGVDAMVCSSFVWDCLAQLCPACRPRVAWPMRARVSPLRARPTVTDVWPDPSAGADEREVRLLANPSDLWVAPGYAVKIVADGQHTTVLYDEPPASFFPDQTRAPRRPRSERTASANRCRHLVGTPTPRREVPVNPNPNPNPNPRSNPNPNPAL